MNIIPIDDLKQHLNLTCIRSVRNWCDSRDVYIMHRGTKTECVSETEFELTFNKGFIENLKKKFGSGWDKVYALYMNGNIKALSELNESTKVKKMFVPTKTKNKLITDLQTKFLSYAKTS